MLLLRIRSNTIDRIMLLTNNSFFNRLFHRSELRKTRYCCVDQKSPTMREIAHSQHTPADFTGRKGGIDSCFICALLGFCKVYMYMFLLCSVFGVILFLFYSSHKTAKLFSVAVSTGPTVKLLYIPTLLHMVVVYPWCRDCNRVSTTFPFLFLARTTVH